MGLIEYTFPLVENCDNCKGHGCHELGNYTMNQIVVHCLNRGFHQKVDSKNTFKHAKVYCNICDGAGAFEMPKLELEVCTKM